MRIWKRREQNLNQEIEDYLARETADHLARGLSPEEARDAARRKLGNASRVKEDTRAAWGFLWLERLWQDVIHGARLFAKSPGFTLVAVLSIALGTGTNVAMFSAADALLLRPLPIERPDELYAVGTRYQLEDFTRFSMSYADYADLRDRSRTFQILAGYAYVDAAFSASPGVQPRVREALLVTGNFFPAVGVQAELGRVFRPEEDQVPERDAVVVLSHAFWEEEFGSDPDVLGRTVSLNRTVYTVIGVAPAAFTGMSPFSRPAFYIPIMMWPRLNSYPGQRQLDDRDLRFVTVKGRLKPGVSIDEARAEAAAIGRALETAYPETNRNVEILVQTELETRALDFPPNARMSAMALALAIAVMMAACANLAGLLLSRAPVRAREIALRLAVGAPKTRLFRQLMTENFLLALAGGVFGLAMGAGLIQWIQQVQFSQDFSWRLHFQFDRRVLGYSLLAAVTSVFLFSFAPALQAARTELASAIKNTGAMALGRRRLWGRNMLVAGQVTIALVLLTFTMVVYRGFDREFGQGPGYRTDHLLMMTFDPTLADYDAAAAARFYDRLLESVRAVPGVRSAALTSSVPMGFGRWNFATIAPEGYSSPGGQEDRNVRTHFAATVDESYFSTMAMPLTGGRAFRDTDDAAAAQVAVVNQTLADRSWPGQNPVGKRFRAGGPEGPWVEVIGVTPTSKYLWPGEGPTPFVYFPRRQNPVSRMTLLLESAGDPAELTSPVRAAVKSLDSELPVSEVRTMEEFYDARAVVAGRLSVRIVGGMGLSGMLLSMVGLYGLVAYTASRRTREIGIRIAVGADQASVLRLMMRQGFALALLGVIVGFIASRGAVRWVAAIFPWTASAQLPEYLMVAAASLIVAMLAAYLPARRASRVDPMVALRNE